MNVSIAAKVCVILCLVLEVQCSEKRQSDSCSDPESYFSSYCWNVITNEDNYDYDTLTAILCTVCRQDLIDYYRECDDTETAEVDEACTSLGYPTTPPTSPPTSGNTVSNRRISWRCFFSDCSHLCYSCFVLLLLIIDSP